VSAERRSVVAVIPARGGSKRIAGKNLLPLAGAPLVAHTVRHAGDARLVDEVIVSTDDPAIAEIAREAGAQVVERPPELSGDEATSESAVVHALDARGGPDPDLVVLLQATSPVRRAGDVDAAIERLLAEGADSLLSVTESKRFLWAPSGDGARPVNYDFARRPREQDMPPQFQENGSIYVTRTALLRESENRLGGRIALHPMSYWTAFQLDEPEDAELLEWILSRPEYAPAADWPERIDLVVFDFDGVMTDNTVVVSEGGDEAVVCHRGDGWGMARLRDAGIPMLVLSTERHPVVAARCAKLGVPCLQAIEDKAGELARHLERERIDPARTVYVGNDVNDLGCMEAVGLPVAVADAEPAVLAAAKLVLSRPGGRGAVRELCELVLARAGRG
jgi:YrbI family 3-deoxy-D-manno-octulosonate 8-phosphate phosphatase